MKALMWLKRLFKTATLLDEVVMELQDAEVALIKAQTGKEWAEAMIVYNELRIKRLTTKLKTIATSKKKEEPNEQKLASVA